MYPDSAEGPLCRLWGFPADWRIGWNRWSRWLRHCRRLADRLDRTRRREGHRLRSDRPAIGTVATCSWCTCPSCPRCPLRSANATGRWTTRRLLPIWAFSFLHWAAFASRWSGTAIGVLRPSTLSPPACTHATKKKKRKRVVTVTDTVTTQYAYWGGFPGYRGLWYAYTTTLNSTSTITRLNAVELTTTFTTYGYPKLGLVVG